MMRGFCSAFILRNGSEESPEPLSLNMDEAIC